MAMRLTGLMSGLDTDSVIQELVAARRTKVDNAKKAQTKLEWKTDAWKDLNSKLKSFQSKLNNLRFTGDYMKKTTKVSNSNAVSVLTGDTAMNSVQTLKIKQMAKTAYLTGGKISAKNAAGNDIDVNALTNMQNLGLTGTKASLTGAEVTAVAGGEVTGSTTMSELGITEDTTFTITRGSGETKTITIGAADSIDDVLQKFEGTGLTATFAEGKFSITAFGASSEADFNITSDNQEALKALGWSTENGAVKVDGRDGATFTVTKGDGTTVNINVGAGTTISDLMNQLKNAGLNVNFDEKQKRFFISAQDSGKDADFNITAGDEQSQALLKTLGLAFAPENATDKEKEGYASKVDGQDAMIELNGAIFTNKNNTFEINGLTITALDETGDDEITLTTEVDTDGIYDMIKDFIKSYSELINEMDKLYNADSAKDYEPLTNEEKEGMSEKEIEEWEKKIKESLLRRDEDLYAINTNTLQKYMMDGFQVNGKTMHLSDFGINTLSYFEAPENERHAYHIDGDEDDENTAEKDNELKKMIANDPDTVVSFFTQLTQTLYTKMSERSKSIEGYRTFGSFYDDKKMKSDYDGYTSKIKDLEKKLQAYEDKWYNKFAQMESAMAKLQNSATSITSLLGG